jgi:hypothetical protein
MKKIFFFFLLSFFCVGGANAGDWLPGFEDVPQMERTFVVEDGGFIYSVGEGKIVQATVISSEVSRRKFQQFYSDALSELGWRRVRNTRELQIFTRGADELRIEMVSESPLEARLTLTPKE